MCMCVRETEYQQQNSLTKPRPHLNFTDESFLHQISQYTIHNFCIFLTTNGSLSHIIWQKLFVFSRWPEMAYKNINKHPHRVYHTHAHPSIRQSGTARGSAAAGLVECHPIPSLFQLILDPQHIPLWSCHQWVKYNHNNILALHFHHFTHIMQDNV